MASILKTQSTQPASSTPTPVVFNIEDMQQRADDYLAQARLQAQQILRTAEEDALSIREQARRDGLAEMEKDFAGQVTEEARRISEHRCRSAVASCEAAITELCDGTANWLSLWRTQTVLLATKMAEKLVRRQASDHQVEVLGVWLSEALNLAVSARDVKIHVHPDDFAVAGQLLQHIAKATPQAASAEILADPEIEQGGCKLQTSHGHIDQQLSRQLERLVEQLA